MEIGVIGSEDFVLGFKLTGIRKAYGASKEEIEPTVKKILNDRDVGILVMHGDDVKYISPLLRKRLRESVEPVLVTIGEKEETDLRDKVRRAMGVDLWKK
jgi:V/A-type H+-transporting ATPase subunit F